jgi:hypothetical protein
MFWHGAFRNLICSNFTLHKTQEIARSGFLFQKKEALRDLRLTLQTCVSTCGSLKYQRRPHLLPQKHIIRPASHAAQARQPGRRFSSDENDSEFEDNHRDNWQQIFGISFTVRARHF